MADVDDDAAVVRPRCHGHGGGGGGEMTSSVLSSAVQPCHVHERRRCRCWVQSGVLCLQTRGVGRGGGAGTCRSAGVVKVRQVNPTFHVHIIVAGRYQYGTRGCSRRKAIWHVQMLSNAAQAQAPISRLRDGTERAVPAHTAISTNSALAKAHASKHNP